MPPYLVYCYVRNGAVQAGYSSTVALILLNRVYILVYHCRKFDVQKVSRRRAENMAVFPSFHSTKAPILHFRTQYFIYLIVVRYQIFHQTANFQISTSLPGVYDHRRLRFDTMGFQKRFPKLSFFGRLVLPSWTKCQDERNREIFRFG